MPRIQKMYKDNFFLGKSMLQKIDFYILIRITCYPIKNVLCFPFSGSSRHPLWAYPLVIIYHFLKKNKEIISKTNGSCKYF